MCVVQIDLAEICGPNFEEQRARTAQHIPATSGMMNMMLTQLSTDITVNVTEAVFKQLELALLHPHSGGTSDFKIYEHPQRLIGKILRSELKESGNKTPNPVADQAGQGSGAGQPSSAATDYPPGYSRPDHTTEKLADVIEQFGQVSEDLQKIVRPFAEMLEGNDLISLTKPSNSLMKEQGITAVLHQIVKDQPIVANMLSVVDRNKHFEKVCS